MVPPDQEGQNLPDRDQMRRPFNLENAVEQSQSLDTPAMRPLGTNGYLTQMVATPFVLIALRSKVYRSMSGVATPFPLFNATGSSAMPPDDPFILLRQAI
jgi:hypothetical protein